MASVLLSVVIFTLLSIGLGFRVGIASSSRDSIKPCFSARSSRNGRPLTLFSASGEPEQDYEPPAPVKMENLIEEEKLSPAEYVLGRPGEFKRDAQQVGIDPVRFISYNLLALALALGANFLGVTSTLMSNTSPEFFRSLGVDQIYDVGGFRRYTAQDSKYSFIFPSSWEQDRSILAKKLKLNELPTKLRDASGNTGPDVALTPVKGSVPRSNRINVSVIKTKVLPGFSMKGTLGEPLDAAEFLLKNSIAPVSSGKTYELIGARGDKDRLGGDRYTFEYVVKKADKDGNPLFNQHSISVIMSRGTDLFTLTVVSPDQDWGERGADAGRVAASFELVS